MTHSPPTIMLILWSAWVMQAVLSAWKVRQFRRLYDRPRREALQSHCPSTAVIVPFKGVDQDLVNGIAGLCEQDYPSYELLAVVESPEDPAHRVLTEQFKRYPHRHTRVLIAGPAGPNEGQKVHNQLFAIDHLLSQDPGQGAQPEVWAFADSDAVPGPNWLRDLVGPLLQEDKTGVTTGYRWLIPVPPEAPTETDAFATGHSYDGATIWSHLASIMNSSVACLMGKDRFSHAWGGSMALTAKTAKRGDLRGRLAGALCDDYQFSRLGRDLGLRIYFAPRCLVATPVNFDLAGLINFAHRQYLLTRVYAPGLFILALAMTSLYIIGWTSATAWLLASVLTDPSSGGWRWPTAAIACVFTANQVRSSLRRQVVSKALGNQVIDQLRTTLRIERWAPFIWMTLHWLLIVCSAFGRTMRWRGIRYRLWAPQRVERID